MRSSHLSLGLAAVAGVAFGVGGACSFPDVATAPAGDGGAPSSTTTLAGPTTTTASLAGPTSSSSASGSSTDVGGGTSVASTTQGGGGSGSSSDGGGGSGAGSAGGGGSSSTGADGGGGSAGTLSGAGGGVLDVACGNGCVPLPSSEGGDASSSSASGHPQDGPSGDCDDDGDPNSDDCQPCNDEVNDLVAASAWFDTAYAKFPPGSGTSFDYDCSGGATLEYVYESNGCTVYSGMNCPDADIFTTSPACGGTATVQGCRVTGLLGANCTSDGPSSEIGVRCR